MAEKIDIDQFKTKVKSFQSTFSMSQAALARMAGVAEGTLSIVLKGTYPANPAEVISKIMAIIEREEAKITNKIKSLDFVETSVSEKIAFALDLAVWDTKIVCIVGDSGLGKTWAVKKYVENNPSAILVEADPTYAVKTVLENIARRLDIADVYGRNSELLEAVVQKLKGSGRMILIDEAEYLTDTALDIVRRIHDKADVPVALVGMPHLLTNVIGKKNKHAQIYSRMNLCKLASLSIEDAQSIVASIFGNVEKQITKTFFECSRGTTRILADLIRITQRILVKNNAEISVTSIKLAAENVIQV